MATFKFYIPAINLMGAGCLQEAAADIQGHGYRKALIVTDKILGQIGVVGRLAALLAEHGIGAVVFDETRPNPTVANVEAGLAIIRAHGCDWRPSTSALRWPAAYSQWRWRSPASGSGASSSARY